MQKLLYESIRTLEAGSVTLEVGEKLGCFDVDGCNHNRADSEQGESDTDFAKRRKLNLNRLLYFRICILI